MDQLIAGSNSDNAGAIDIVCEHDEPYEADHVPEAGYVAMYPTCGKGCPRLTVIGTGTSVGIRRDGGE